MSSTKSDINKALKKLTTNDNAAKSSKPVTISSQPQGTSNKSNSTSTSTYVDNRSYQEKLNATFISSITHHNDDLFERAVTAKAQINAYPITFGDGYVTTEPPITAAIIYHNEYARKRLLELHAEIDVPADDGFTPIQTALSIGCLDSTKDLIAHGAKLGFRRYNGDNALHIVVKNMTSYSIIRNAEWEGDSEEESLFGEPLYEWFMQKNGNAKPKVPAKGKYYGNEELLEFVLEVLGASVIFVDNNDGVKPLDILQNPVANKKRFVGDGGVEPIPFSLGKDGVLIFKNLVLKNRNGSDSITIQELQFDLSNMRKTFENAAEERVQSVVLAKKLNQMGNNVTNLEQRVQEEFKESEEDRHFKAEQAKFDVDPVVRSFRTAFNRRFRGALGGSVIISGKNVQRAENTTGDRVGQGLSFISSYVPVFGSVVGLLGFGIKKFKDWSEEKKHAQIAGLFNDTVEQDQLSQRLALDLIKYCSFLTDKTIIKDEDKAKELGEKLAASAYLMILAVEPKDKHMIRKMLLEGIKTSGILDKQFASYETHLKKLATQNMDAIYKSTTNVNAANGASEGKAIVHDYSRKQQLLKQPLDNKTIETEVKTKIAASNK